MESVVIGNQEWSSNNLNTNTFRNGDEIKLVTNSNDWFDLNNKKEPACCYYNFNTSNGEKLGLLYNWFTVVDPRNISPSGWRVPSEEDFKVLIDFLGKDSGKHLKSKSLWKSGDDGKGEDTHGFKAIPSGIHNQKGKYFDSLKDVVNFWSINDRVEDLGTLNEVDVGKAATLNFNHSYTFIKEFNKGLGCSIRLIKE